MTLGFWDPKPVRLPLLLRGDRIPIDNQWLFLVPLKGGRWHIIPQLAVYTTYIPLKIMDFNLVLFVVFEV